MCPTPSFHAQIFHITTAPNPLSPHSHPPLPPRIEIRMWCWKPHCSSRRCASRGPTTRGRSPPRCDLVYPYRVPMLSGQPVMYGWLASNSIGCKEALLCMLQATIDRAAPLVPQRTAGRDCRRDAACDAALRASRCAGHHVPVRRPGGCSRCPVCWRHRQLSVGQPDGK